MDGAKTDTVHFDELRKALRLVNELRDLPAGSPAQQRHALVGLAGLVGAQVGLWCESEGIQRGQVTIRRALDFGWSCESERRVFLTFVDSAQWVTLDPSMAPLARLATQPLSTFTRDQLVDDRGWYGSEHVQRFRREARVDSCIYAAYAPGGDSAVCFSLHRPWGQRAFSERERRLVELFHHESRFLYAPQTDLAPALLDGLSPRLRDTLRGLVRGLGEKQLADELGLSAHTVHGYIKDLHRHFGVRSRGELLALCLAGADRTRSAGVDRRPRSGSDANRTRLHGRGQ